MSPALLTHLTQHPHFTVTVLTGAGISAESGISTFRDANGLWENHSIEEVASPEGFANNPALVHRFYNQRRKQLSSGQAQANTAHLALAKLESALGERFHLITQNVDNLHEQAGNKRVLHMHGELLKVKCQVTGLSYAMHTDISTKSICECCNSNGNLRPDIVWFGEIPYHMDAIERILSNTDVFISIGTSGNVYPAAGFVQLTNAYGAYSLEINLIPSETHNAFHEHRYGRATQVVNELVEQLLLRI